MMFIEKQIKRIAIFRALQLGDLLCVIPAVRALRKAHPEAKITFIGLPGSREIISRFPTYIDQFIAFPGYRGLPEQPYDEASFNYFIQEVRDEAFDLILQMQGKGSIVNTMIRSFGARYTGGFCERKEYEDPFFLTYPNFGHEIKRHLLLMQHLGIPSDGTHLEFPIVDLDAQQLQTAGFDVGERPYICLHPGSRGSWRQWPPLYFAAIGDYCADMGQKVIITGTTAETHLAKEILALMKSKPVLLCGKTSLGAVAVLIKNATGLIANCTGVSHLASAMKTKSVIISMDGEPERWGPIDTDLHRTVDWTKTSDYNVVLKDVGELFFGI